MFGTYANIHETCTCMCLSVRLTAQLYMYVSSSVTHTSPHRVEFSGIVAREKPINLGQVGEDRPVVYCLSAAKFRLQHVQNNMHCI